MRCGVLALLTEPRSAVASGKALDDRDDLVAAEAVLACEFEEIPCPGEYGTALGRAGHSDATPAAKLQQAFIPQPARLASGGLPVP